jgi:hypothetical protein
MKSCSLKKNFHFYLICFGLFPVGIGLIDERSGSFGIDRSDHVWFLSPLSLPPLGFSAMEQEKRKESFLCEDSSYS